MKSFFLEKTDIYLQYHFRSKPLDMSDLDLYLICIKMAENIQVVMLFFRLL